MAQRRMIAIKIVDTDNFLAMPISARLLYYDFILRADDDGFVDAPKKILKIIGCSDDDIKILCAKDYIFPFKSGICVIKDWKIHNYIQKDRYHNTQYKKEFKELSIDENGSYAKRVQIGHGMDTEVRLGKDSIGKDSKEAEIQNFSVPVPTDNIQGEPKKEKKCNNFIKPTVEEIKQYCTEEHFKCDPMSIYDYYEANGWMIGKNKMKDWKAAVRNWERRDFNNMKSKSNLDNIKLPPIKEKEYKPEPLPEWLRD